VVRGGRRFSQVKGNLLSLFLHKPQGKRNQEQQEGVASRGHPFLIDGAGRFRNEKRWSRKTVLKIIIRNGGTRIIIIPMPIQMEFLAV